MQHFPRRLRNIALSGVAIAMLLSTVSCATSDTPPPSETELPEVTINVGTVLSATEPTNVALMEISRAVAERTDGRLKVEVFPDAQLGSDADMQDAAVQGASQAAFFDPSGVAQTTGVDELNALGGPFIFSDIDDIYAVLDSDLMAEWNKQINDAGLHIITWKFYFGQRHIISETGYPNPADLGNVIMRIPETTAHMKTFELLARPTTLPFAEVYSALQQGVIDAAEAPLGTLYASSLYEVADTITLTGHFTNIGAWGISTDVWNALPEEYRDILTEEFDRGAELSTRLTLEAETTLRTKMADELGVNFVEPDLAAYQAATQPYYDSFPSWRTGLYDQLRDIMSK